MSKPLTIEELKALEVSDWVWFEYDEYRIEGCYVRICAVNDKQLITSHTLPVNAYDYSDYGKTWLAYKNKEQAEAKGEIVELPCMKTLTDRYGVLYRVYFMNYAWGENGVIDFYSCRSIKEAQCLLAERKGE